MTKPINPTSEDERLDNVAIANAPRDLEKRVEANMQLLNQLNELGGTDNLDLTLLVKQKVDLLEHVVFNMLPDGAHTAFALIYEQIVGNALESAVAVTIEQRGLKLAVPHEGLIIPIK